MDLSKLPKLSQTPAPPPLKAEQESGTAALPASSASGGVACPACRAMVPAGQRYCGMCGADTRAALISPQPMTFAEAWISIVLGIILLVVSPRPFQYMRLHGTPSEFEKLWTFSDKAGDPLPYTKSAFFKVDVALALFAGVLLLDGIALLLARKKYVALVALITTLAAIVVNVYALTSTYSEIGFQLFPAVAIAVGGYMALFQWSTYQMLRRQSA